MWPPPLLRRPKFDGGRVVSTQLRLVELRSPTFGIGSELLLGDDRLEHAVSRYLPLTGSW
jgi:hypothetical protein